MNKHIKLLVSVLFIVIIMLTFGLTRFYFDVSKNTGTVKEPVEIIKYMNNDSSNNRIFESDNNLYGIIDTNERIIVSPQWNSLKFAGNSFCIASRKINNQLLFGCIDYEENIIVPFVYKSLEPRLIGNVTIYIATVKDDNSIILYNNSFQPLLNYSCKSVEFKNNNIILSNNENTYTYAFAENNLIFKEAVVCDKALDTDLRLVSSSRILLSKLDSAMLEKALRNFSAYVTYAFSGDFSLIDNSDSNNVPSAYTVFAPQSSVFLTASLKEVDRISVYNLKESDGTQFMYVSATVTTDIEYSENEEVLHAQREYTIKSKFRYSDSTIYMVSGSIDDMSFIPDIPEIPSEETTQEG